MKVSELIERLQQLERESPDEPNPLASIGRGWPTPRPPRRPKVSPTIEASAGPSTLEPVLEVKETSTEGVEVDASIPVTVVSGEEETQVPKAVSESTVEHEPAEEGASAVLSESAAPTAPNPATSESSVAPASMEEEPAVEEASAITGENVAPSAPPSLPDEPPSSVADERPVSPEEELWQTLTTDVTRKRRAFADAERELRQSFASLSRHIRQYGSSERTRVWEDRAYDWTWALDQIQPNLKEAREYREEEAKRKKEQEKREAERRAALERAKQLEEEARRLTQQAREACLRATYANPNHPGIHLPERPRRSCCCWWCGFSGVIRPKLCPRIAEHHFWRRSADGKSWKYEGPGSST